MNSGEEVADREDDDRLLIAALVLGGIALLLSKLQFNLAPSGTLAPSLTGPTINRGPTVTNNPPGVSPDVGAVHLGFPLNGARSITAHGYYGAKRYKLNFMGIRDSATAFYPGQAPDHIHHGIDFPAADGEAVIAPEAGRLEAANAGDLGAPGAVALVSSAPGGRRWVFVHVIPKDALPREVQAGDWIATVGGDHLHLQLTVGGQFVDPSGFFQ